MMLQLFGNNHNNNNNYMMVFAQQGTFTLVNANTGLDIVTIVSNGNYSLNLAKYPSNAAFDIRFNAIGNVGSVAFTMYVQVVLQDEFSLYSIVSNQAPFHLGGGTIGYLPVTVLTTLDTYLLEATPYSGKDLTGAVVGTTATLNLAVAPKNGITSLVLVDVTTRKQYPIIPNPFSFLFTINLSDYSSHAQFTIQAKTVGLVNRVEFQLLIGETVPPNLTTVDYQAPFTLDGDSTRRHYKAVPALSSTGSYVLIATPYTGPNGQPPILVRLTIVRS
jgi:hypothetical protein